MDSTRSIKINGSCDRCALSKVRCDQVRPICGRCYGIGQNLGIEPPCNYSISLRTLKKTCGTSSQRKSSTSSKQPPTRSMEPNLSTNSKDFGHASPIDRHSVDIQYVANVSPGMATPNGPDHWSGGSSNAYFDYGKGQTRSDAYTNTYFSQGMVFPTYSSAEYYSESSNASSNMSLNDMWSTLSHPPSASSPSTSAPMQASTSEMPFVTAPSISGEREPQQCCAPRICSTVQALWQASKKDAATTLDQALVLSRTALDVATSALRCPCSSGTGAEFSLAFLIHVSLCFFRGILQGLLGSASLDSGASMNFNSPMKIGVYTMDADDEQKIKLQIVHSEFSKVSRMVEAFGQRFSGGGQSQAVVPAMLMQCLRSELERCMEMLQARPR